MHPFTGADGMPAYYAFGVGSGYVHRYAAGHNSQSVHPCGVFGVADTIGWSVLFIGHCGAMNVTSF